MFRFWPTVGRNQACFVKICAAWNCISMFWFSSQMFTKVRRLYFLLILPKAPRQHQCCENDGKGTMRLICMSIFHAVCSSWLAHGHAAYYRNQHSKHLSLIRRVASLHNRFAEISGCYVVRCFPGWNSVTWCLCIVFSGLDLPLHRAQVPLPSSPCAEDKQGFHWWAVYLFLDCVLLVVSLMCNMMLSDLAAVAA